jgi:hypothetical protein
MWSTWRRMLVFETRRSQNKVCGDLVKVGYVRCHWPYGIFLSCVLKFNPPRFGDRRDPSLPASFFRKKCHYIIIIYRVIKYVILLILHPSLHWIYPNIFPNIWLSKTNKLFGNRALLGNYAASSGNFLPTFRDNLLAPSSGFKN